MERTPCHCMEDHQQRICLAKPNNQRFGANASMILVTSRVCVMSLRLLNSFNMLLKIIQILKLIQCSGTSLLGRQLL